MNITIQLPASDVLTLVGICGRAHNQAHHLGEYIEAAAAHDLKEILKRSLTDAGIKLPKGHDFLW